MGDGKEVAVVLALEGVMDSNEGGVAFGLEADDRSARGTALDGLENDGMVRIELQMSSNGGEQCVSSHVGEWEEECGRVRRPKDLRRGGRR